MPTKRTRISRAFAAPVAAPVIEFLRSGELPAKEDAPGGWFEAFLKARDSFAPRHANTGLREDWAGVRDELMAEWIAERPGTRPHGWWLFEAPRWTGPFKSRCAGLEWYLGLNAEPRRRLGGIGTPSHEVLNVWPHYAFGIPTSWVSPFDERYYNDRALYVSGRPIGTGYRDFAGLAPRADDPPRFEAQAAYLERHGLLTAAERRRLPADAFEPECLDCCDVDEEPDPRETAPHVWDHPAFDDRNEER